METDYTDWPILILPKKNSTFNIDDGKECWKDFVMDINVTTLNTEKKSITLYSGSCNIKLVQTYKIVNEKPNTLIIAENHICPTYSQPQVCIEPTINPQVFKDYEGVNAWELEETFSICNDNINDILAFEDSNSSVSYCISPFAIKDHIIYEGSNLELSSEVNNHITIQQNTTYITQNTKEDVLPNYNNRTERDGQDNSDTASTEPEYEFEVTEMLSPEYINDIETITKEELKNLGVENETSALKQLMSTGVQKNSKQRKTILYAGQNSRKGKTIQSITIDSPSHDCDGYDDAQNELICDGPIPSRKTRSSSIKKKYRCEKCKQMFDQLSAFRQHTVKKHKNASSPRFDVTFTCDECGKTFKDQAKFEHHCSGHGNPDLECSKCNKVFATKFTLRAHTKIHDRKYPCEYCTRTYNTNGGLNKHMVKYHCIYTCAICPFTTIKYTTYVDHEAMHKTSQQADETDLLEDSTSESTILLQNKLLSSFKDVDSEIEKFAEADSVLDKIISNKMFYQINKSNAKKSDRRFDKVCDVCYKNFDRIADLKRHLIEHMIKNTLSKTPVASDGTLSFLCEICKQQTFTKIDKYKAHLREHARLTLYNCTFCDKSFSDSSNFSKHKKIHSASYFQCDLCQRKFNTKKYVDTSHGLAHNKLTDGM